MAESSRGTPFPDRVRTRIWQEEPHADNPFLVERARCHGYALDEMARALDPAQTLYLLLRGELPERTQHELMRRLLAVCCNPGPRHAATRAVVNAAASGTQPHALPAIGLALLSGTHLGAAEVERSARFIARHRSDDPIALAARLSPLPLAGEGGRRPGEGLLVDEAPSPPPLSRIRERGEKDPLSRMRERGEEDQRIAPGFGTLAGGIDPLAKQLASILLEVASETGALHWAARFAAAAEIHGCGWLMPGLAAAACCELGFTPAAAALVYQYASLPGLIAHALEYLGKGIASLPFVPDERYELLDQREQPA